MPMEKILKYATLGGALLVFLGVLKLAIYFDYFGISITHYIDTTTALTLFLEDYRTLIVLFVVGFVHYSFSEDIYMKFDKILTNLLEQIIVQFRWFYLIVFTLLAAIMTILIYFNIVPLSDFVIYLTCFGYLQFFVFLFMKRKKDMNGNWDWDGMRFHKIFQVLAAASIILIIPLISLREIRATKFNDSDIIIHMEDGNIIDTRKNFINLRKTGNFYFLINESNNTRVIINTDKVSKVELLD